MLLGGPQRKLFMACVLVGFASLLSLDLHFAPASLAAGDTLDASAASSADPVPAPSSAAPVPRAAERAVFPAPARVPTIVARFETASTEPVDESAIRALATAMIEDHDVSIVLEGHSDTRGGDDYNHKISLERADWVKARLVALGVSAERIETVGLGATRPLRSDDQDASSINRRVEVRWLGSANREAPPPPRAPKSAASPASSTPPREPRPPMTAPLDAGAARAAPAASVTAASSAAASESAPSPMHDASVRSTEGSTPSEESARPSPVVDKSLEPGDE